MLMGDMNTNIIEEMMEREARATAGTRYVGYGGQAPQQRPL